MRATFIKLLSVLFILLSLISCGTRVIGYGVVLWSGGLTAGNTENGALIPLYGESDLRDTYALTQDRKLEIDKWRIDFFRKKEDAQRARNRYEPYINVYAASTANGVRIISDTGKNADMLYRMRKDEVVKIIAREEEEQLVDGKTGYWYEVVTANGTRGFSFSHYLTVFTQDDLVSDTDDQSRLNNFESMLDYSFYPEYYQVMLEKERILLSRINPDYGFFVNRKKKNIDIRGEDGNYRFSYSSITETDYGDFLFNDSPVKVAMISPARIQVTYATSRGNKIAKYVRLEKSIDAIRAMEVNRQEAAYLSLIGGGSQLRSAAYGSLSFLSDRGFRWTDFNRLVPRYIPADFDGTGRVDLAWFLPASLAHLFGGVLALELGEGIPPLHFLYSLTKEGLQLELVTNVNKEERIIKSRSATPLILFFSY